MLLIDLNFIHTGIKIDKESEKVEKKKPIFEVLKLGTKHNISSILFHKIENAFNG